MKILKRVLIVIAVAFVAIQFVPIGCDHVNPPVTQAAVWSSPDAEAIAKRTCYDCHSHETHWPWYSNVAPVRWFVANHVEEGREHLNFSMWDVKQKHAHEAAEEVEEGEMPLPPYLLTHSEAKLSDADKKTLMEGLKLVTASMPQGDDNVKLPPTAKPTPGEEPLKTAPEDKPKTATED